MPLNESFNRQAAPGVNMRLAKLNAVPSTDDLAFALSLAGKNPKNIVELPWKAATSPVNYLLKVTYCTGPEPLWILVVENAEDTPELWNYETIDAPLIHSLITAEAERGTYKSPHAEPDLPVDLPTGGNGTPLAQPEANQSLFSLSSYQSGLDKGAFSGGFDQFRQQMLNQSVPSLSNAAETAESAPPPPAAAPTFDPPPPPPPTPAAPIPPAFAPPAFAPPAFAPPAFAPPAFAPPAFAPPPANPPVPPTPPLEAMPIAPPFPDTVTPPTPPLPTPTPTPPRPPAFAPLTPSFSTNRHSAVDADVSIDSAVAQNPPELQRPIPDPPVAQPVVAPLPAAQTANTQGPKQLPNPVNLDRSAVDSIYASFTNSDSGFISHAAFLFFLVNEFGRFQRDPKPLSVVRFVLFLKTNDPAAPMQPLPMPAVKEAGKRMFSVTRSLDWVAHYEYEFAILMPYTNRQQASEIVHKIVQAIGSAPLLQGLDPRQVACHFGIACMPDDCTHPGVLLAAAEEARRHAQENQLAVSTVADY